MASGDTAPRKHARATTHMEHHGLICVRERPTLSRGSSPGTTLILYNWHVSGSPILVFPPTTDRGTGEEPARFTSQNHITDCSAELCRIPLSHHYSERARAPKDMAVAMPRVIKIKHDFESQSHRQGAASPQH
eukprot:scaffold33001_cov135-Isochrysis_galbana.AAC.1